jgi:hypothetical protein
MNKAEVAHLTSGLALASGLGDKELSKTFMQRD